MPTILDPATLTQRITVSPDQCGGLPCIRALRIPVVTVLNMLADGMSDAEILAAYPDLESADLDAARLFAVRRTANELAKAG